MAASLAADPLGKEQGGNNDEDCYSGTSSLLQKMY